MKYILATIFLLSITSSYAKSGNKVSIDIENLEYKRPENNNGTGGKLDFHKVKMTWDDMKVSLKNTASFLESKIKVRPTYVNFNTPGLSISLPMPYNSAFFSIDNMALKESKFLLNQDFFNFDGQRFEVSDGVSKLVLDKFNMYCNAPDEVDMTSLDGLIHGCLSEFILNGKNETDLAGAKLEYFDNSDKENGIYLNSRLKDLTLEHSVFKLDMEEGQLDIADYRVNLGKAQISCEKPEAIIELNVEELKNGCINNIAIEAPEVQVKDLKEGTEYKIHLNTLKAHKEKFYAQLDKVAIIKEDATTLLNNLVISCNRNENDEFYDLHKTIAGCVDKAKITISTTSSKAVGIEDKNEEKGFFSGWFGSDDQNPAETQTANNIQITILKNKLDFYASIELPIVPRFRVNFEAYVEHNPEAGTISLDIMRFKAIKIFKIRQALLWIAGIMTSDMENIKVDDKKITIQL